jgi:uncharacterized protein
MSHRGSLLCLPSGIYGWDLTAREGLDQGSLERLFAEAADIEVLLIGMGPAPARIPRELHAALRNAQISSDGMSTGAAVRTFNVLLAEDRAVAAALIAVD